MARTQVQSELIATNAISGTIIADNAITATHIATNSISGTLIQDSGIVTTMIAANNITSTKIVTDGVLTRHIADDQVTEAKLANAINTSIAAKLPLAGGTMTGNIVMGDDTSIGIADDAERIEFDGAGDISLLGANVGIGTTTPSQILNVEATSTPVIEISTLDDNNPASASALDLVEKQPTHAANTATFGQTGVYGYRIQLNGSDNSLRIKSGSQTTVNDRITLDRDTGKVGIGTTTTNKIFNIADPAEGGETLKLHFEANSSADKWEIYGYDRTNSHYTTMSLGNTAVYITSDKRVGIGTDETDEAYLIVKAPTEVATGGSYNQFGNLHVSTDTQGVDNGGTISMGGLGRTSGPTEYFRYAQLSGRAESNTNGTPQGYMCFETTSGVTNLSTERMRIGSNGHLLVGRTTTSVGGEGHRIDPNGETFHFADTASAMTTLHVYDSQDNAYRFYVDAAGTNAGRINATQTTIQGISDIRLKENVRDLEMGMNDLMKLKPRTFDWKEGEGAQKANASGFIAQEAEAAGFEEFVGDYKHEKIKDAKSFGQGGLVPLLVKCIQELEIRVKELEG